MSRLQCRPSDPLPRVPRAVAAVPCRNRAGGRSGFTLVEVLVALAIVAIALSTGLKAAGALAGNAQRLADVTAAQWCADNLLTNLRLGRQFPGTGDSDFDCEQLGRSFRGQLQVRGTLNPNFRRVEARVLDPQGQLLVTISTVLTRL